MEESRQTLFLLFLLCYLLLNGEVTVLVRFTCIVQAFHTLWFGVASLKGTGFVQTHQPRGAHTLVQ